MTEHVAIGFVQPDAVKLVVHQHNEWHTARYNHADCVPIYVKAPDPVADLLARTADIHTTVCSACGGTGTMEI